MAERPNNHDFATALAALPRERTALLPALLLAQEAFGAVTREAEETIATHLRPALDIDDRQFAALARQNPDLRLERSAEGDVIVMAPAGGETGHRNAGITAQLWAWAVRDGSGAAFDSSTGFTLPNGAIRSPDAAWVRGARLRALSAEERARFLPLCPDFVIELRSPSDSLRAVEAKLAEYIANGARLGWLLDVANRRAHIYRPGAPVEHLDAPAVLAADPELPGFTLDLAPIWVPRF